jgi:hypothetical protein
MRPPAPRRGLARCPPPATTAMMGLRRRAGDDSQYCARELPAVAEPRLRPAQVLVHDSQRPAGGDAGVFRPAQWRQQPRRETRAPTPVPVSAAQRRPPGKPTARWAAWSRAAPGSAPPNGDDGTPGQGRLCSASGGIDHRPRSRPPWLSMTGIVRGGGEGGATPGGGGGGKGGGRPRVGRRRDAFSPHVLIAVRRFLRRGQGSYIGNGGRQTSNNQKLTKGGFRQGGLNFAPLPTPPKKTQSAVGIGGRGWQDSICRRKEGPGMRLS